MLQANKPVRVSCPPVKDTHKHTQTKRLQLKHAHMYTTLLKHTYVDVLPVACGRVSDLLEQEQGVSVSSVTGFSSSSVFPDQKHSVLVLCINTELMQRPLRCDALFFSAGLHCWSVLGGYLVICFCQGLQSRQSQLLLEGTGPLILMRQAYWPITSLQ